MCSSRKYPYSSPRQRRALLLQTPYPLQISFPGGACHTPSHPGISVIFHLGWEPPGKNISIQKAVSLYHLAKCDCFGDKVKKILFMLIDGLINSILLCRVLFQLIINSEPLTKSNNSPINLTPGKKNSKSQPPSPHPLRAASFWTPLPLGIPLPSVGRVWIFFGTTQFHLVL